MLPSLPWVPKGCRVLCICFVNILKGTVVNPKLPWVHPHPVYDGAEQRFVPAELWQEISAGIAPVLVVGGTGGSVWVAFFVLNPPEMTRQFSLTAWGNYIKLAASSGSLCI